MSRERPTISVDEGTHVVEGAATDSHYIAGTTSINKSAEPSTDVVPLVKIGDFSAGNEFSFSEGEMSFQRAKKAEFLWDDERGLEAYEFPLQLLPEHESGEDVLVLPDEPGEESETTCEPGEYMS